MFNELVSVLHLESWIGFPFQFPVSYTAVWEGTTYKSTYKSAWTSYKSTYNSPWTSYKSTYKSAWTSYKSTYNSPEPSYKLTYKSS